MTELRERTNPAAKGLRVFVHFSDGEFTKRRYLLPPATILKTYMDPQGPEIAFHVLHLDNEAPFTSKGEPLVGRPRLRREWLVAKSPTNALEQLGKGTERTRRVEVMLYVKRDSCIPCSETLEVERDLLEICPAVIGLMPEERRGRTSRAIGTQTEGKTVTIAVDDNEWADLYESYEGPKESRPHKVRLNTIIEVQLTLWSKAIIHHWSSQSPKKERELLGIYRPNSGSDRQLVQLKPGFNLYYFAGSARRVSSQKYFDPTWQKDKEHHEVLLDCGLPVVLEEITDPGEPSSFVQKEEELLMGLCFLSGSISFSGVRFRTPLVGRVLSITEMDFVPPFVLLEVELEPPSTSPEVRISYYSEELESLKDVDLGRYVPPT